MVMINLLDGNRTPDERTWLVRLCYRLTSDPDAAEDLAQETLLAAWRAAHTLRDSNSRAAWLAAIARNQCRQWLRRQRRDRKHLVCQSFEECADRPDALPATVGDPALALERDELATLLRRAFALLPADTRTALLGRFVDELPHAALASRLGLSSAASMKRVERGLRMLRRMLTTALADEAHNLDLRLPDHEIWQTTHIWCPLCGSAHLQGQLQPADGLLQLRCPICNRDGGQLVSSGPSSPLDVVTFKPALNRLLLWIHDYYHQRAIAGTVPCLRCGQRVRLRLGHPPAGLRLGIPPRSITDCHGIYAWCAECETAAGVEAWWSFTLGLPEVRRFWHEHSRIRALPERSVQAGGVEAVLTGFESITGHARIEVTTTSSTLAVQHIDRTTRA
jgi:RNA polymerase sigma-70 factor (ECF subfamily)